MRRSFEMIINEMVSGEKADIGPWNQTAARASKSFHEKLPEYQPTPLRSLAHQAKRLGLGGIFVKDESWRFGLDSFKALGASFAMHVVAEERKGKGPCTFVTATDGNHGRAVAWMARKLGQKAVVYMPTGSSQRRLAHILAEGAEASITEKTMTAPFAWRLQERGSGDGF